MLCTRFLIVSAVVAVLPTTALAEVCDKYFEDWPAQAGHGILTYEIMVGFRTIGIAGLLIWGASHLARPHMRMVFGALGLTVSAFMLVASIGDEVVQHEVWRFAVNEGCKSGYATGTAAFGVVLMMFAGLIGGSLWGVWGSQRGMAR